MESAQAEQAAIHMLANAIVSYFVDGDNWLGVISGVIRGLSGVIRGLSRVIRGYKFGRTAPNIISTYNPT